MVSHELEVIDGRFTGQRVGLHPFAENKAKLAQHLATEHMFDLSRLTPMETITRMHTNWNCLDIRLPSIRTGSLDASRRKRVGK